MRQSKIDSTWVLLDIDSVVYAISCESVLSLSQLSKVTPLPNSPREFRGTVEFRSRLIQLIEARSLLGLKTVEQDAIDFYNMIDARCQENIDWVSALEQSVKDDVEFNLTTDPHKDSFGQWYDSYHPKKTNIMFLTTLGQFDAPHRAILEAGEAVKKLVHNGDKQKATELVDSIKSTELQEMTYLCEELKNAYRDSSREIMVVLGEQEYCIGLSVDQVLSIENLYDIDEDLIGQQITNTDYLSGIAKRKDGSFALILNDEYLMDKYIPI